MTIYCDFCPAEHEDDADVCWPHEPRCADPFGCDCHIAACPGCCPCSDVGFEVTHASACPPQETAGGAHVLPASPTSAPARGVPARLAGNSATPSTTAPAPSASRSWPQNAGDGVPERVQADGATGEPGAAHGPTTNDKTAGAATPTASVHPESTSSQEVLT